MAFSGPEDHCYDDLAAKADQALYVSKKSGKGRHSVYGEESESPDRELQAIVWSGSRNVTSMIEFALPDSVHLQQVSSVGEIRQFLQQKEEKEILPLLVDVSEEADHGCDVWSQLKELHKEHAISMVAICKEGNLAQMKCALETGEIQDLLLAPLEANTLKRRVQNWMKNCILR